MRVILKMVFIKALWIVPLFYFSAVLCLAQDSPDNNNYKVEVRLIQVEVRVTKDGKPVPGLEANDFQLKENGKEQEISFLSYIEKPAEVVLERQKAESASEKTVRS